MKSIFTTGEAAEICNVSQQTIIRCFDSGRLKGFKVPGSRFRRIPRAALMAFMKSHGIPTETLDSGKQRVLVVGSGANGWTDALKTSGRFELKCAATGYEAGVLTQEFAPDVIVLGAMESPAEQMTMCKTIRQNSDLKHIRIIVSGKLAAGQAEKLLHSGANAVAEGNAEKVIQQIEAVLRD